MGTQQRSSMLSVGFLRRVANRTEFDDRKSDQIIPLSIRNVLSF